MSSAESDASANKNNLEIKTNQTISENGSFYTWPEAPGQAHRTASHSKANALSWLCESDDSPDFRRLVLESFHDLQFYCSGQSTANPYLSGTDGQVTSPEPEPTKPTKKQRRSKGIEDSTCSAESDATQVSSDARSDTSDSSSTKKKKQMTSSKKTKRKSVDGTVDSKDEDEPASPTVSESGSPTAPPPRKKMRKSVELGSLKSSTSDVNIPMTAETPLPPEVEDFVPAVLKWADNVGSPMSEVHILDYEYNRKGYPIRRRPQKVEMCTRTQKIVLIIAASIIGLIIIIMVIVLFSSPQAPSAQPVAPPTNIQIPYM